MEEEQISDTFTFKKRTVYVLLGLIGIIVLSIFAFSSKTQNDILEVTPSGMLYQNASDNYTGDTNIQAVGFFLFKTNFTEYQDYVKDYKEVCFIQE